MNEYYKQPVIIFGLALPLLGLVLLLSIGLHYRSKFENGYEVRKGQYVAFQKVAKQREALEARVGGQGRLMKRWMNLLEETPDSSVNAVFSDLQKRYSSSELQQTSTRSSPASGGIGGASKQPATQLQMGFRGTYRGLQNAFLEMETRMPQLQLETFKLRKETGRNLLNAEVTYTAWLKE